MTLKIAAAVFMGIMAVLVVLRIPTWQKEMQEKGARHALYRLTPEALIARCGAPLKDYDETQEMPIPTRILWYKRDAVTYRITFLKVNGIWNLAVMEDNTGLFHYYTVVDRIKSLPCLDSK